MSIAKPGHGAEPPCLLGEPVHDRVAAVREDHEQRAGAVLRRAPERLDRVERRAVADDRDDGAVGPRHAQPDRGGQREPEPAHGRAERAERLARRQAHEQLGTVRRRLLDHDRIAREALGQRREDVGRAQRLAGGRRSRRRGRHANGAGGASVARGQDARQLGAHRPGRRQHREVGRAPVHLGAIAARPSRRVVPAFTNGPGTNGYWRKTGAPTASTTSCGASVSRRRTRSAGRWPANSGWSCGKPARALKDSCQTGHIEPLGERDQRLPGVGVVRARTDDDRRALGPAMSAASSATAVAVCRPSTNDAARRGALVRPHPHRRASRPSARSRAPARARSPPRARARAIAPGTSCGRTGSSTQTGYSPASPRSLPARNGSVARCRRSCWPTTTTSGARLTRAVASAPTALPRPAVVCRTASAGSPRPIAQPVAMPTTELSWSASTKRKSAGRSVSSLISVEPGIGEDRGQPVLAPDVEGRLANGLAQPRSQRTHAPE